MISLREYTRKKLEISKMKRLLRSCIYMAYLLIILIKNRRKQNQKYNVLIIFHYIFEND